MSIHVGILGANLGVAAGSDESAAFARYAEASGFESLWCADHVVVPVQQESVHPYSRSGEFEGPDWPIPDPFVWSAFVAAHTSRIKLATGVLVLPQRQVALVAKQVATLDSLSKGRILLGVGTGWLSEEFDAMGVPFEARGARTDECIAALRAMWTPGKGSFRGEVVNIPECWCVPQPAAGHVPIIVGGHSPAAARRAGRLGDGFFPLVSSVEELEPLIEVMRGAAEAHGRDPDGIEITTKVSRRSDEATLDAFRGLGVARILLPRTTLDIESALAELDGYSPVLRWARCSHATDERTEPAR